MGGGGVGFWEVGTSATQSGSEQPRQGSFFFVFQGVDAARHT